MQQTSDDKRQNPAKAIITNKDSLLSDIERLVSVPKHAIEISPKGKTQKIPNEFILRIRQEIGHSVGMKVLAKKAGGQWFITLLTDKHVIIRQYHYQYNGHPNPDGNTTGRSHKHFPTKRHPLQENHRDTESWAYDPGPFPHDFVEAVRLFCSECNISLEYVQERLELFR